MEPREPRTSYCGGSTLLAEWLAKMLEYVQYGLIMRSLGDVGTHRSTRADTSPRRDRMHATRGQ